VRHRGWLLDPYIRGRNAVYWFKTTDGKAVKAEERYNPIIVAKPRLGFTVDNLIYLFEEHPFVISARPVSRFMSIHRDKKSQYVEVKVDQGDDLDEVVRYGERLNEVEELFNIGLIPIQWHLIYRGIELRRHDTPKFINDMQKERIETMFRHDTLEQVMTRGMHEAHDIAARSITRIRLGKVDPHDLVISKRLRREVKEYKSRQPHIVAAMLGKATNISEYILLNTESQNPMLRVMPASMMNDSHRRYDRKKYASMVRRAAWNLLRPFVPGEKSIGTRLYERTRLDSFA